MRKTRRPRRVHRLGRLVEPAVGQRERCNQDHQRVREAIEHLRQHDADRPVHAAAQQPALQEALVAEDVDQRDGGQQRGRKQRQQGDGQEEALGAQARAGEAIGVEEGERHDDGGGQRRDPEAVPQRGNQRRRRDVADIVGEADEAPLAILEALGEQRGERQGDSDQQECDQRQDSGAHHDVLGREPAGRAQLDGKGHAPGSETLSKTRSDSAGKPTVSV